MALLTGTSYTGLQVLQEIVGKNLRIAPILFKQYSHIASAFLDVNKLGGQDDGLTIDVKMDNGITPMLTVDGKSIKWVDYNTFDFETAVTSTADVTITAGEMSLIVDDASGFAENDRITIVSENPVVGTQDIADAIVQTVNTSTDTVTLKLQTVNGSPTDFPATLALVEGQVVRRLYWARNDCDDITRGSNVPTGAEAQSFIQHFSRQITFNKQETNIIYKWEGEVPNALAFKFKHNLGILFQELAKAIYKGKNTNAGAGVYDKMEMLGLEEIVRSVGGAKDYSTLGGTVNHIDELYTDLESVFTAGGSGDGQICMLVNDRMIGQLARVDRAFVRYDKKVDALGLQLPSISTPYGDVEILRDPIMNVLYPYAMAFIFPKKNIGLWIRENDAYDPANGVSKADESIRVFERYTNLHECKAFDIYFEMGMYAHGVTDTARPSYKSIKNFTADAL
jgi:hypothetical protein